MNHESEPRRVRYWAAHLVLFGLGQGLLVALGQSWLLRTFTEGPHPVAWFLNGADGGLLVNTGRIWVLVFLVDTVWTWGWFLFLRRRAAAR